MNFHQCFEKCSIITPDVRKQPQTSMESLLTFLGRLRIPNEQSLEGAMVHKPMVKFSGGGASPKLMLFQISQNIGGFRQNSSQGF